MSGIETPEYKGTGSCHHGLCRASNGLPSNAVHVWALSLILFPCKISTTCEAVSSQLAQSWSTPAQILHDSHDSGPMAQVSAPCPEISLLKKWALPL